MTNKKSVIRHTSLVIGFLLLCHATWADDAVLTLPGEAKGAAMGEAYSAAATGAEGLWYNPATLARRDVPSVSLMHTMYLENVTYDTIGAAYPFGNQHAVAIGASYLSAGSVPSYDNTGAAQPSYTPTDICARLGYAKSFFATSFGLSFFFLRTTIASSAATYGFNLGFHQNLGPTSLALVGENFGKKLTYRDTAQDLPTRVRAGVSLRLLPVLTVNTDLVKPKDGAVWGGIGTEFHLNMASTYDFALRAGYNTRSSDVTGLHGFSAGAGFGIAGSNINYAWVPFGDLGQTHRISLDIQWGEQPFNPNSERELRSQTLLKPSPMATSRNAVSANINASINKAMAMPAVPWRKGKANWSKAKDKMIDLLARDALCTSTGARALVTRTQGTVRYQANGEESKWVRLGAGKYLFDGDSIRTYQNSSAHLVLANGVKAEVGANTKITFATDGDICQHAAANLQEGDVYAVSEDGKDIQIKTPLGDAALKDASARITYDGKVLLMRVQSGTGTFTADGVLTPVRARTTFAKTNDGKVQKTGNDLDADRESNVDIAKPDFRRTPGRWDKDFAKTFQTEMMRLDSVPGLKLAEYVKDTSLRANLRTKVIGMMEHERDMRTQMEGFRKDIAEFRELRETLRKAVDGDKPDLRGEHRAQLKQAIRALNNAQDSFDKIQKELKLYLREMRTNQEFLASLPIVRMLNITAQESTIPFATGRAVVPDESKSVLDTIAASMSQMRPVRVVVEGHTDKSGSSLANARLSKQRAEAVAQYLRTKTGLPANLFVTKGMGSSQPLEDGDSPEIMAKNRRVEIWFEMRGL